MHCILRLQPSNIQMCGSSSIRVKRYQVAAITIVIYDSLILLHRELEGRQTVIKWIYVLIKLTGLIIFGLNFVAFLVPPQTLTNASWELQLCFVRHWIAGLSVFFSHWKN
ncbi:hypothetical protein AGABI1DRAFT_107065 [Agaricus bisporus var. burnettii JB137-S8]|uniref:Uncharacterized protein n=1 Tax=Agaricus bisporus var. burnettii (strain JB137-S8 / ATCC MYA-4627 / FGSC 10392) TaxID=597362 RepID=K5X8Y1_AGABU|nr:uncharacterized protein AGABI1DRAFT_107065 [Agaricus bisporus var. burnettii JB137-S8]EKM79658.1 hypothetical protein AGABI1DRAFT_107065 [Agaricus bisporus var. burnettii JB137-S8]